MDLDKLKEAEDRLAAARKAANPPFLDELEKATKPKRKPFLINSGIEP